MSVLGNLISIIVVLFIGYLVNKTGAKLRYLAPCCFIGIFILTFIITANFLLPEGAYIQFFLNKNFLLNRHAIDVLFASTGFASLGTILLVISVWAIRKNVFF